MPSDPPLTNREILPSVLYESPPSNYSHVLWSCLQYWMNQNFIPLPCSFALCNSTKTCNAKICIFCAFWYVFNVVVYKGTTKPRTQFTASIICKTTVLALKLLQFISLICQEMCPRDDNFLWYIVIHHSPLLPFMISILSLIGSVDRVIWILYNNTIKMILPLYTLFWLGGGFTGVIVNFVAIKYVLDKSIVMSGEGPTFRGGKKSPKRRLLPDLKILT